MQPTLGFLFCGHHQSFQSSVIPMPLRSSFLDECCCGNRSRCPASRLCHWVFGQIDFTSMRVIVSSRNGLKRVSSFPMNESHHATSPRFGSIGLVVMFLFQRRLWCATRLRR